MHVQILIKIALPVTTAMVVALANPVFAVEPEEPASSSSVPTPDDQYRISPSVPVAQLHLGVGSAYQLGVGMEWFETWHAFMSGAIERGIGLEVVSEWRRTGFQNLAIIGRARTIGLSDYFPLILGIDLFGGAATTGARPQGVGGFSIYATGILFEFGYRYQRVLIPWSSPEWFGRHFFFVRLGFRVGKCGPTDADCEPLW